MAKLQQGAVAKRIDPAFAPIAAAFASDPDVKAGMMMACYGLKVRGKIFAMHVDGKLVVKLPKARVDALVAAKVGANFDPRGGRPMKEWIAVPVKATSWLGLAKEAYAFVVDGIARAR